MRVNQEYIKTEVWGFGKFTQRGFDMRASSVKFKFFLHMPHILRIVAIVLLVALVIGGIVFGVRGCTSTKNPLTDGGVAIVGVSPSVEFFAMGTGFVAFDGTYARAYDAKGQLLWENSPDSSQGYQCASSSALLAVYKANSIYVYDTAGNTAFTVPVDQAIQSVAVGQTCVAIRYQDDSIQVIDKTGKAVETIAPTDGTVMDFGIYSQRDLLWVLLLNADGIEPKSQLNIHQPGKMLIAGYSTTQQLYYRPLAFGNQIYIVGTKTVDVRNTNDTSESSLQVYGWTLRDSVSTTDKLNILLALTEQGDNPTSLRVISGSTSTDLRMPAGCTDMIMGAKSVYGFSGQTIYSVPLEGGKTGTYSLPYAVDEVLCRLSDNRALLSGEGQVYLVTLP